MRRRSHIFELLLENVCVQTVLKIDIDELFRLSLTVAQYQEGWRCRGG